MFLWSSSHGCICSNHHWYCRGSDGELLTIINAAAQAATISTKITGSSAANRIVTGTGADLNLAAELRSVLSMTQVPLAGVLMAVRAVAHCGFSSLDIANDTDVWGNRYCSGYSRHLHHFNMAQTTASQTFTIPNPTNTNDNQRQDHHHQQHLLC